MESADATLTAALDRRSFLVRPLGIAGATAASGLALPAAEPPANSAERAPYEAPKPAPNRKATPIIDGRDNLRITKVETRLIKPRWLFLKIHTNAGIVGLGEPILEGRAKTCATAVEELAPYLIGKDPRAVVHHWQAMYRHAFYRGGPILTSALSGVDQALWDIKGKALGVPVHELLGGPTRTRVRVYISVGTPDKLKQLKQLGFTTFKTSPHQEHRPRI